MRPVILLRILLLALIVAGANVGGFAYAHMGRTAAGNPFFGGQADPTGFWPAYLSYVQGMVAGRFTGSAAYGDQLWPVLLDAAMASFGLFAVALTVSLGLGLIIGLAGVRLSPPGVRSWLTAVTLLGLSTPSFFIGRLLIALLLWLLIYLPWQTPLLPIQGFGWDVHLVLPVVALAVRPTAQIAQIVAGLLAGELGKQYVVVARGKGVAEGRVIAHHALRNIWAPVAQAGASATRLLVGEQIVVEWLFGWPGLGYLIAGALIPAEFAAASVESRFLDPPLVASLLTIFAALFVTVDLVAGLLARLADPRQRGA